MSKDGKHATIYNLSENGVSVATEKNLDSKFHAQKVLGEGPMDSTIFRVGPGSVASLAVRGVDDFFGKGCRTMESPSQKVSLLEATA